MLPPLSQLLVVLTLLASCGFLITILTLFRERVEDARHAAQAGWILRGEPLFGAGSIPMYYTNLERAADRRLFMEKYFGVAGALTEVRGVDSAGANELAKWLVRPKEVLSAAEETGHPNSMWVVDYAKSVNATVEQLASSISHWLAIRRAFDDGMKVALILEDNLSVALIPFWTLTLGEVVRKASSRNPKWNVIALHHSWKSEKDYINESELWKKSPSIRIYGNLSKSWGSSAYLISRRGMKTMLHALSSLPAETSGSSRAFFDCRRSIPPILPCNPDTLIRAIFAADDSALRVMPPMLSVNMLYDNLEDSVLEEAVQNAKPGDVEVDTTNSRPYEAAFAMQLRMALVDFEFKRVKEVMMDIQRFRGGSGDLSWLETDLAEELLRRRRAGVWRIREPLKKK